MCGTRKKSFDDQSLGRPDFYWDRTKDSSKAGMETFEELAAKIQKEDRRGITKFKKVRRKGKNESLKTKDDCRQ